MGPLLHVVLQSASHLKAGALTLLSQLFFTMTSVGLVLITSHYGTYEDSARVGVALGLLAPVQLLLGMQHSVVLLVGRAQYADIVGARIGLTGLLAIFSVSCAAIYEDTIIVTMALLRTSDFFFEIQLADHIRTKRYGRGVTYAFVRAIVVIATAWAVMAFASDTNLMFIFAWAVSMPWVWFALQHIRGTTQRKVLMLIRTTKTLGLSAMFASLAPNIPKYWLAFQPHSSETLGGYSNLLTLVMGATILISAVTPQMLRFFSRQGFSTVLLHSGIVAASIWLVGLVAISNFGKPLLGILLGDDYVKLAIFLDIFLLYYIALFLMHLAGSLLIERGLYTHVFMGSILNCMVVAAMIYGLTPDGLEQVIRAVTIAGWACVAFLFAALFYSDIKPKPQVM